MIQPLSELLHYYEIRMLALSEYSDRVWNRFNWFMTVEVATFGFFFSWSERISSEIPLQPGVAWVGIVVAVLWALMGVEDFASLRRHRLRVHAVDQQVRALFQNMKMNITLEQTRRLASFRQTWLLFLFPFLVVAAWVWILLTAS